MDLFKIKLKGSTLLEIVIAMALLGIVSSVVLIIFENVYRASPSIKKHQVSMFLDGEINKTYQSQNTKNRIAEFKNISVNIEFSDHVSNKNLKVGFFSAFINENEEVIIEKRILIHQYSNE